MGSAPPGILSLFVCQKILIQLEEIQRTVTRNGQALNKLFCEGSLQELEVHGLAHK